MESSPSQPTIRVLDIVSGTSVDGPGLRTTVYFAGCPHHCLGCHNPQSWEMSGGQEMSVTELRDILLAENLPVTYSGGDPMAQILTLTYLSRLLKEGGVENIWCYTGYTFEGILNSSELRQLLPWIDVLVDGPFIKELHSSELIFRGSSNQRLIDVRASLSENRIVEWQSDF